MTNEPAPKQNFSVFASLEMAILFMSLTAITVLLGAWCPQESQVGREKVFEAFSPDMAKFLIKYGFSDIFHSPWFLFLIAMLTLNMVAVSFQRVFPKVKLLKVVMPFLKGRQIENMPVHRKVYLGQNLSSAAALSFVVNELAKRRFTVKVSGQAMTAESGKYGRLAATITHIGLLTLLAGVTVTSWTGFSGFQPVLLGDTMSLAKSEHSKLWIGKLPPWGVRVDSTRRENYPTGEPKQWYSNLSIVDPQGKVLKQGEISVNNPLTYENVDFYQSSWGIDAVDVSFNGHKQHMQVEPMGKRYAAFLPLDQSTVLIFSVLDTVAPMRVFAKRPEWDAPKMISEIKPGESVTLGSVQIKFEKVIPVSGLQYKCDPGLITVYIAFGFIITGVMLAAIPHRHVWACVEENVPSTVETADAEDADKTLKLNATDSDDGDKTLKLNATNGDDSETSEEAAVSNTAEPRDPLADQPGLVLVIGGKSLKAKTGFEKLLNKLVESLNELKEQNSPTAVASAIQTEKVTINENQNVHLDAKTEREERVPAEAVKERDELVAAGVETHSGDS
jgi:cytochrome c biogenesis protein